MDSPYTKIKLYRALFFSARLTREAEPLSLAQATSVSHKKSLYPNKKALYKAFWSAAIVGRCSNLFSENLKYI